MKNNYYYLADDPKRELDFTYDDKGKKVKLHIFREKFLYRDPDDKRTIKGKWRLIPFHGNYGHPNGDIQFEEININYHLLSILLNRDNPWNIDFISNPKGLPHNLSLELEMLINNDPNKKNYYHYSYITLEELDSFDWHRRFKFKQLINMNQLAYILDGGFCYGKRLNLDVDLEKTNLNILDFDIAINDYFANNKYLKVINRIENNLTRDDMARMYTILEYSSSYYELINAYSSFHKTVIDPLRHLSNNDPNSVRLVVFIRDLTKKELNLK